MHASGQRTDTPKRYRQPLRIRASDEVVPECQQAPARRADTLGVSAERFLAASLSADETLNTADGFLVMVHAPAGALPEHAGIELNDPPQVEDGSVMAPETLRRLCCDSSVVRVLEQSVEGEPLDVNRKTRVISPALRRALKRCDGGCRHPRFVDGHHITQWADGGETPISNVVSLCRYHHRLVYEGGYYNVKDDSAFRFFRLLFRFGGFDISALQPAAAPVDPAHWQPMTRWGSAPILPSTGPP